MEKHLARTSKFLSLVLRHKPETVGVTLDAEGWIGIDELLEALKQHGQPVSREELDTVVEENNKKRFVIRDGRIRANQGHSIGVDLQLKPAVPPDVLYHGTAERFLEAIRGEGLKKMNRQHVHLSAGQDTARNVGTRHGRPVILHIDSIGMQAAGYEFFLSENGVWLTDQVPWVFIGEG